MDALAGSLHELRRDAVRAAMTSSQRCEACRGVCAKVFLRLEPEGQAPLRAPGCQLLTRDALAAAPSAAAAVAGWSSWTEPMRLLLLLPPPTPTALPVLRADAAPTPPALAVGVEGRRPLPRLRPVVGGACADADPRPAKRCGAAALSAARPASDPAAASPARAPSVAAKSPDPLAAESCVAALERASVACAQATSAATAASLEGAADATEEED
jgi:hypothetical protein